MTEHATIAEDRRTADAFADSWNNLPDGSVYTRDQFADWLAPIGRDSVRNATVLELGCGNGSLMLHMASWRPKLLVGVDLGGSVTAARRNLARSGFADWRIDQADLTSYTSGGYDLVYCIGVLHHLQHPKKGLDAVIANLRPGGRFHCWVYAREGTAVIRWLVDPLRRMCSRLPWWLTKYAVATPLVLPYYVYSQLITALPKHRLCAMLPLYAYSLWIARREFAFYRHVAFDQLVTPQTVYIDRGTIVRWLESYDCLDRTSLYITMRNGNSWKFGGRRQ
jgi:SAM-dependent methyltransferase